MAGAKCRSWVHAVVVQAKALNPFFCGRRESPHVRSRPGSPPLHSTLALLNSVHQVLSPPKMPGNCLPSLPLPCAISSLSLVRYRTNDHSVPVAYGNRDVLVRGYVDQAVISCGSEVIARHPRSYQRDNFVYDPIHYLPLLEQKPGALDQAAPPRGTVLRRPNGPTSRRP